MKKLIYLYSLIGIAFLANPQAISACEEIEATVTINPSKDRFCLFGGSQCVKHVTKVRCADGKLPTI